MVCRSFRRSRWLVPALLAGGAIAPLPSAPLHAQGILPAVNPCTGISVDQTSLRNVLAATNTPINAAVQGKINALVGLPILGGLVTPLAVDVTAIVNTAVTANPLTLRVLDTAGNAVLPGACNLTSDALTLNTQGGISIGGNAVTGLGLNGLAATAGTSDSIALGNNASTGALVTGAVAIGTGASVTAINGIALGNGSIASRGALTGYVAAGITGPSNSVGSVSIGAAGSLRQLTNLAPGSTLTDAATVGQVQGALDAVATVNAAVGVNTTAITGLTGTVATLNGQVTGNTTAITGLTTDVTGLTASVGTLTGQVAGNTGAIATLNGQVTGNTTAIATLNGQVTGSAAAITGLTTDLAALDGRVTGNTGAIAGLTTSVGTLTGQVAGNTGAIATLNGSVTALDGRVTANTTAIAGVTASVAGLTSGLATLDGRVTGIATDVAGLTTGLATLGGQVAGNTTAIANIDARVLNNTTAITNIDARVLSNTTDIASIDARVTNNTTQLGTIDARVTLNTTAITNLQTQVANVPVGYVQDANPAVPSTVPTNTAAMIGVGGAAVRLTNIAAGNVATGSTDAVTGGQLAATNAALATNVSATTTNQAAIAATNTALAANVAATATNQAAIAALDASAVKYDNAANTSLTLAGAGGTRVTNVAAGAVATGSTDAVNGAQLAATNAQVTQNATAITTITNNLSGSTVAAVQYSNADTPTMSNGGTITNDVTLIGAVAAAPVAIHNVAAGRTATDAVNLGQVQSQLTTAMASAMSYTDSRLAAAMGAVGTRLDQVDFDLGELRKDAMSGVAGAMAFAGIPQTMDPNKAMLGGAVAHYRGRTAFAFGFSSGLNDGKAAVKVGGSVDSSGHMGVTAGGGISF